MSSQCQTWKETLGHCQWCHHGQNTMPVLKHTAESEWVKRAPNSLQSCIERGTVLENGTREEVSCFIKHQESPTAVSRSLNLGIWIAKREPEQWCHNKMAAQSGISGTFWGQAFGHGGQRPWRAMSRGVRQGPRGPGWGSGGRPGGRGRPGWERVGGAWLVTGWRARGGRWAAWGPRVCTWQRWNEPKWEERKTTFDWKGGGGETNDHVNWIGKQKSLKAL